HRGPANLRSPPPAPATSSSRPAALPRHLRLAVWRPRPTTPPIPSGSCRGPRWRSLRFPPGVPAPRQHLIRSRRSPRARLVVGEIGLGFAPHVLDWLNDRPTGLHHVLPRVQRGVADDGVEQQRLIGRRGT